jgi:hypothetical protein
MPMCNLKARLSKLEKRIKPKKVRFNLTQQYEATRLQLASWAKEFAPISEEEMEPYLQAGTDRGTDNWLALGIIARRVSSDWGRRIQDGLTAIEQRAESNSHSVGIQLLNDVRSAVSTDIKPEWTSTDLYNEVVYKEAAEGKRILRQ